MKDLVAVSHPALSDTALGRVGGVAPPTGRGAAVAEQRLADAARRAARSRARRDRVLRVVAPLVMAALLALAWQWWAADADTLMVPSFTEAVGAAFDLAREGSFWSALASTGTAAGLGFLAAVAIGVPVGVVMGRHPRFDRIANVYVSLLLTVPVAAFIPLLLIATGVGQTTRVLVVLLFAVPFVMVNTRAGVRKVDRRLVDMARSFGASEREVWTRILLPAASPAIFVGVRAGLSRAVNGVFVAELILAASGIGKLLLEARATFEGARLYGAVLLVLVISLAVLTAVRLIQRLLFPWAGERAAHTPRRTR